MSIELRPLGVKCNIACQYCYQNPQRDVERPKKHYDMEKMRQAIFRSGQSFTLFGGEALLIPLDDLEEILSWGFEYYGTTAIQTNGILITDKHIELFKLFNVSVGISVDGPDELNDIRWAQSLKNTRKSTQATHNNIQRLCEEGIIPGIIIVLHKGNALPQHFEKMGAWLQQLDQFGITSVRLHLMEVDDTSVAKNYVLSEKQNIEALLYFHELKRSFKQIKIDIFSEIERLQKADDQKTSCVWNACDPYTTAAVQGIEGDGKQSNCGRTNKEGIDFVKSTLPSYMRYISLYNTPQENGGCKGCRFFSMCKGNCPGTAIDGDWRNRTEHCGVWKEIFTLTERALIEKGEVPLSRHDLLPTIEQTQQTHWMNGKNVSIQSILRTLQSSITTAENGV